jgi:hypothetical protein
MTPIRRTTMLTAIGLGTAGLMAASVVFTKSQVTTSYRVRTAAASESARSGLQQALDDHLQTLSDLSRSLGELPAANADEYRERAVRAATQAPAFAAINFLDHRFIETYLYPYGPNRSLEGLDLKTRFDALPAAHRAVASNNPAATGLVPLAQGGQGFLTYVPVRRKDRWEGLVEGTLERNEFGKRFVVRAVPPDHDASVLDESNDTPFYTTALRPETTFGPYDYYVTLRFVDRRWWVVLHPRTSPSPLWPLTGVMLLELGLGAFLVRRLITVGGLRDAATTSRLPDVPL